MAPPVPFIPPRRSCSTARAVSTGHSERRRTLQRYFTMPIDWTSIEQARHGRGRAPRPDPRALPDPTEPHGRRGQGDARGPRARSSARRRRDALGNRGLRLGGAARVERARRMDRGPGWATPREVRGLVAQSARVQRPGRPQARARRAARARLHRPPEPRSRPLPHVVLGGEVGLLHDPTRGRLASRRRVPSSRRLDAHGRFAHVRRGPARRLDPARRAAHDDGLPPGARQRQPVRDRGDGGARACARHAEAPIQLPARVEPRDHRAPLLAPPQPRDSSATSRTGLRSRAWATGAESRTSGVGAATRARTELQRSCCATTRDATLLDWSPYGGDERQFCAPGFDLPFGAFSRSPADAFPQYHSSDDDLTVVTPEALTDSYRTLLSIVDVFERDATYVNASPYGEPQLGTSRALPFGRRRTEPGGGVSLASQP